MKSLTCWNLKIDILAIGYLGGLYILAVMGTFVFFAAGVTGTSPLTLFSWWVFWASTIVAYGVILLLIFGPKMGSE